MGRKEKGPRLASMRVVAGPSSVRALLDRAPGCRASSERESLSLLGLKAGEDRWSIDWPPRKSSQASSETLDWDWLDGGNRLPCPVPSLA